MLFPTGIRHENPDTLANNLTRIIAKETDGSRDERLDARLLVDTIIASETVCGMERRWASRVLGAPSAVVHSFMSRVTMAKPPLGPSATVTGVGVTLAEK